MRKVHTQPRISLSLPPLHSTTTASGRLLVGEAARDPRRHGREFIVIVSILIIIAKRLPPSGMYDGQCTVPLVPSLSPHHTDRPQTNPPPGSQAGVTAARRFRSRLLLAARPP